MKKRDRIQFDAKTHTYWYDGRRLQGITSLVCKRLSKRYPEAVPVIDFHRAHGTYVHKSFEYLIKYNVPSASEEVRFIVDSLKQRYTEPVGFASEFLVSDFMFYATAIDIVVFKDWDVPVKHVDIFDIKTGAFDREYCTLQLNINKYLAEIEKDLIVDNMFVIATKEKRVYTIYPINQSRVLNLLYGGNYGKE